MATSFTLTNMVKNIIVFGGTGHQGSAFVKAIAAHNTSSASPAYAIHLLVRNPDSDRAQSLARLNGVKLVEAAHYMEAPDEAFDNARLNVGDVYGAFIMCGYMDAEKETAQGVRVVKSCAAHGVRHIVYGSVMYNDQIEMEDGCGPKRAIEFAIRQTNMKWTMLRSADFMDNWLPNDGFVGRLWHTVLLNKTFKDHPDRALPMVSTRDVGRAAATAMTSGDRFTNQDIYLSGDRLTMDEVKETYQSVMGVPIAQSWGVTATAALWWDDHVKNLSKFYDSEAGFDHVDPDSCKGVLPNPETFRSFLERYKREQAVAKAMAS